MLLHSGVNSNGMSFTEYATGKIIDVNHAWINATGISREKATGKTALELGLWASKAEREMCVAELNQNGRVVDFETRLVMKGEESSYLIQAQSVHIADKHFALWEFKCLTERKHAEEVALTLKNQLKSTLEAIPDLLFDADLNGRIFDYHSPRTDLLAAPPDLFLGKLFSDVLPKDVANVCMSAILEAHENGFSTGKQYELQLPHGRFWFEASVSRKSVDQGQEPRFIFLARDITKRKFARVSRILCKRNFSAATASCHQTE